MTTMIVAAMVAVMEPGVSGELPRALDIQSPTSVMWLSADPASEHQTADCAIQPPHKWICSTLTETSAGVVVIETADATGFVVLGADGSRLGGTAKWGRLLRISSEALATPADASTLAIVPMRTERPRARPNATTLDALGEPDVQTWWVSATAFWIAGQTISSDSFVRIRAPGAAALYVPIERLAIEPQEPISIALEPEQSIEGRVESQSGDVVGGAIVELFMLVPGVTPTTAGPALNRATVFRLGETQTDESGGFAFGGLDARKYKIVVTEFQAGRAELWTDTSTPLTIRLTPPFVVSGRVLRQQLPEGGVTVRFIPEAAAWRDSTDAEKLLTSDAVTDESGRFRLTLPPIAAGAVQFIAGDGATARVQLTASAPASDIALGDVDLHEPMRVELRTDVDDCVLSALGPAGADTVSIVRAESSGFTHAFQLPEAGRWMLQAECGGNVRPVSPTAMGVSEKGEVSPTDVRVIR